MIVVRAPGEPSSRAAGAGALLLLAAGLACAPPEAAPAGRARSGLGLGAVGCAESRVAVTAAQLSASGSYAGSAPELAFDGSTGTAWNSGGAPPQWIQVDLGVPVPLTRVRLAVDQLPAGPSAHVLSVATDGVPVRDVARRVGETEAGQWLEIPIRHRARTIRITTTASPSWVSWLEIELYQDASIAPEHFGYYCSGCSWVGSGDYTAATADHANLVWIADHPVEDVVPRIQAAAALGMRSVVSVTPVFFSGPSLAPDYPARWAAFAAGLAPHVEHIAALYPMDEPDLQGVDDATLATAIVAIKATFPDLPVAVIYSPLTVASGNRPGLASYDWVGIDCYSAGGYACGATPYEDAYYALRGLLDPARQRTFLVPQAGLPVGTPSSAADALALEIDRYVALSRRDLAVVGVVPFLYQTFDDGVSSWNGLEAYPALRAKFAAVGQALQQEHAAATLICAPDAAPAVPDAADASAAGGDAGAGGGGADAARSTPDAASGGATGEGGTGCACRVGGRGAASRRPGNPGAGAWLAAAWLVAAAARACARARHGRGRGRGRRPHRGRRRHLQGHSSVQSGAQPSPARVLPSSQTSPIG